MVTAQELLARSAELCAKSRRLCEMSGELLIASAALLDRRESRERFRRTVNTARLLRFQGDGALSSD